MKSSRSLFFQVTLMLFALFAVVWVMSLLKDPSKLPTDVLLLDPAAPQQAGRIETPSEPITAKVQFGKSKAHNSGSHSKFHNESESDSNSK